MKIGLATAPHFEGPYTVASDERIFGLDKIGLIEDGKLTHLFFATMDGPGGFGNSTTSWNMVVPLESE